MCLWGVEDCGILNLIAREVNSLTLVKGCYCQCFSFLKLVYLFIWKVKWQRGTERVTERELFSICCSLPEWPLCPASGPIYSQKTRSPFCFSHGWWRTHVLRPYSGAFPCTLAGSWMRSEGARTQTSAPIRSELQLDIVNYSTGPMSSSNWTLLTLNKYIKDYEI